MKKKLYTIFTWFEDMLIDLRNALSMKFLLLETVHSLLKGMCGGLSCTILMHVNGYNLLCCVHVIPLNVYIFPENCMPLGGSGER